MAQALQFEGIAPEGWDGPMPAGHGGLRWRNAQVVDVSPPGPRDKSGFSSPGDYDASGFVPLTAAASGLSAASNLAGGALSFAIEGGDRFDLLSAWLGAAWNDGLRVKVTGVRDGGAVATLKLRLDRDGPEFVDFGGDFADLDRVVIRSRGGVDADAGDDGAGAAFGLDDLTVLRGNDDLFA